MYLHLLLLAALAFVSFFSQAQNSSPFWSLAGNSNANSVSKLGTTTADPLNLTTANTTRLVIAANGNVGIGTTTPQQRLHVEGALNQAIFVSTTALGSTSGSGMIGYAKALPTAAGQRLGYFLLGSRGGGQSTFNAAGMVGYAGNSWSGTSHPAYLAFETTPQGSATRQERMRIDQNGNVGIGTTSPGALLHAQGAGTAVYGNSTSGSYGVYGKSSYLGVFGDGGTYGVYGYSSDYYGVYGYSGTGYGIYGSSTSSYSDNGSTGVYGSGYYGVHGIGTYGVWGESKNYLGVYGSGVSYGVYGSASSTSSGYGLYGVSGYIGAYASGTSYGFYGVSTNGIGARASSDNNLGGSFYSTNYYGLRAGTGLTSQNWAGVFDGSVYTFGTYQTSDRKLKKNISEFTRAMDIIAQLKPKRYEFIREGKLATLHLPEGKHYGLIAQELQEVLPELVKELDDDLTYQQVTDKPVVITAASGKEAIEPQKASVEKTKDNLTIKAVNYTELIPIMIKGLQELNEKNKEIDELKAEVAELRKMMLEMKSGRSDVTTLSSAYVTQNTPNPTRGTTIIGYHVPEGAAMAKLTLVNQKGQILKEVNLTSRGVGQVSLNTAALPSGVYTYTLWIDGQQAASKQLVVAK